MSRPEIAGRKSRVEIVEFAGWVFYRYPDSEHRSDRLYFSGYVDSKRYWLHRYVWECHHGRPVPDGHHVHHVDENPSNNDPSNLEAKLGFDHLSDHQTDEMREHARRNVVAKAVPAARAWHASPAGLAWHKANGRAAWASRKPERRECVQCGSGFDCVSLRDDDRFCSNKCKSAHRRASGIDDVDRVCEGCGIGFRVNRYKQTRACSRKCGARIRSGPKRTRLLPHG